MLSGQTLYRFLKNLQQIIFTLLKTSLGYVVRFNAALKTGAISAGRATGFSGAFFCIH